MKNVMNFSVMARSISEARTENELLDDLEDYADRRYVIPAIFANNHRTTRGVVA